MLRLLLTNSVIISVLALQLPIASAQENAVYEDQLTQGQTDWVSQTSDTLHSQYQPRNPGTLFQWSSSNETTGGPDLSEALVTDRPDFTEASVTVGRNVAQIEFGYTYTQDNEGGDTRSHSIGEPLLRYGIFADWLELRLAIFPVQERTPRAGGGRGTTTGTEDLYVGFKIALTGQDGVLPEMALMPQMTIPTGSNAFTDESALAGVNWLYSWALSDDWNLAGSSQFNRARDDTSEYYIEFAQSVALGTGLTDELSVYGEWYAFFPSGADTARVQHYLNGGFAYLISNDIQWDIRVGTGLTTASDDFFCGTGLSIRFH
jgi:hypothetical protein